MQNIKAVSRRLQSDAEQNSGVRRLKMEFTAGLEGGLAELSAMSIEQNRTEQISAERISAEQKEQRRTEQNRTEQNNAEQTATEMRSIDGCSKIDCIEKSTY